MYAGHLAAGLAIKAAVPRVPTAALTLLVFLPDLLWLLLAVSGIEIVTPGEWFDGWSHSFATIGLQAALVALVWWRRDAGVAFALAIAVLSHLLLDLPAHPAPLQWYPHAGSGFGDLLHGWAGTPLALGKSISWWVEAAVLLCGAGIYTVRARRIGIRSPSAAAVTLLVGSLHMALG